MIRIKNLEESLDFYCNKLRLKLLRHKEYPQGRFSLCFLATDEGALEIELTYNWDEQTYTQGNNFGHLAYLVDDIYETCQHLQTNGVQILRPPRDGRMAFIKDPNGISIELLQTGKSLPPKEPWVSMPNVGTW
jgi:lactoylglutathione lyase